MLNINIDEVEKKVYFIKLKNKEIYIGRVINKQDIIKKIKEEVKNINLDRNY